MELTKDKIKNYGILILIVIILLLGYGYFNQISKNKDQHQQDTNLTKALTDSLHTYKNKNGELVNEKLTIQTSIKQLEDKNMHLTALQKELVDKVKEVNKNNQVISAALIQMGIKIDGLVDNQPVDQSDSTVRFAFKSDSISYDVLVGNVKALEGKMPFLKFKKFSMENTQFIEFHWKDDKKDGYPTSFSVTNSNPLYKTFNVESYIIPEATRELVKPTWLQKLGKFSKSSGGKILIFSVGVAAGVIIAK